MKPNITYSNNPFFISALLYLSLASISALFTGIGNIFSISGIYHLVWPRVHLITIGTLTHIIFGLLPQIIAKEGEDQFRWDIWIFLNSGFITFIAGRMLIDKVLIISGGTLMFMATSLFFYQLYSLTNRHGQLTFNSGELYYLTGVAFFLLGIIIGTGIWVGWSEYLAIAVPIEVHIHANNWGLASFVFAGLIIDLSSDWFGKESTWKFDNKYIYYFMVPGAIGLIFGPWVPTNWLSVPGLLFHFAATIMLLVNAIILFLRSDFNKNIFQFLSGYIWFFAPVVVAPFIVFKIYDFSLYSVEAFAPEALVYGWLLSTSFMLLSYLHSSFTENSVENGWLSISLIHVGAIFLWISIFSLDNFEFFYGLSYTIWALAIIPVLVKIFSSYTKWIKSDKDSSSKINYLVGYSMFFAFMAVILYLIILSGRVYPDGSGPFTIIPVLGSIGFLLGGLLIYLKNKKLILTGLVVNIIVFAIYFAGHIIQGESMLAFDILTKINQVVLEIFLYQLYLVLE